MRYVFVMNSFPAIIIVSEEFARCEFDCGLMQRV